MNKFLLKALFQLFLLLFLFDNLSNLAYAQKKDSIKVREPLKATANININNNGTSLFPNLSLGKPAAIINLSVGKKNIYFEPELRWGLNGKPWSYIYWLRFRPKRTEHFGFHVGAHPSYVIRENIVTINGKDETRFISQRYLAAEFVPVWYYSPKFALGLHVLASKGLDSYAIQKSYFMSIQPRFPNISLNKNYYLSFFPQVFHLILDSNKGTYFSESLSLNKKNCPIGITSIFTYKLKSTIPGDNIVWNVGLNVKL